MVSGMKGSQARRALELEVARIQAEATVQAARIQSNGATRAAAIVATVALVTTLIGTHAPTAGREVGVPSVIVPASHSTPAPQTVGERTMLGLCQSARSSPNIP